VRRDQDGARRGLGPPWGERAGEGEGLDLMNRWGILDIRVYGLPRLSEYADMVEVKHVFVLGRQIVVESEIIRQHQIWL
jgi:hypothetical protein